MPKTGMQPLRKKALVDAALRAIGQHGSMAVTMSEIAREAGVSPALAHHYFGSKEHLLNETMRALLRSLRADAVAALSACDTPRARLSAVIRVSFDPAQFAPETTAAWLAFYGEAQRVPPLRRLLAVYAARLRSNLLSGLSPLCHADDAQRIAEGAAAMIDGLYLRQSLQPAPMGIAGAAALVEDYIRCQLSALGGRSEP